MRDAAAMRVYSLLHNSTLRVYYRHAYSLPIESGLPERSIVAFLNKNWPHTIPLSVAYLTLVYVLRAFMAARKPFDLRTPLFAWNLLLAAFSILG